MKGQLKSGAGYTVVLLIKDGTSRSGKVSSSGRFSFGGLKNTALKDGSLQIVGKDGRYFGPTVLGGKGSKVSITFSGKSSGKTLDLGTINLKHGYAALQVAAKGLSTAPRVEATQGRPTGAGSLGIVSAPLHSHTLRTTAAAGIGGDQDLDGIVDAFDADDNGDGILDIADQSSRGAELPYVSLNFDFRRTLNAHVRSGLTPEVVDQVVAAENVFGTTFFLSLPPNSTADSGYLVCGDSLSYCRPNTPLGYSGGVMESSNAFRRPMRELLNTSGYPLLEKISVHGNSALVLSMQPRVGRDVFRAGDLYRVVLTSQGREVGSKTFTLPPTLCLFLLSKLTQLVGLQLSSITTR